MHRFSLCVVTLGRKPIGHAPTSGRNPYKKGPEPQLASQFRTMHIVQGQDDIVRVCGEHEQITTTTRTGTDCAVENDGSLVIGEFVDERGVQFWSCRRESSCHRAKR